ncbi:MAG: hypothetical protein QW176_04690 [Candidatus Bathyarchaeia archaeon]
MPRRSRREDRISVRLDLEGELLRKFLAIKGRYGFESSADTVRLLISLEYERMRKESSKDKRGSR